MISIFFDGNLIDENMYMNITQEWVMFDDVFFLGSTSSRKFTLTVPKEVFYTQLRNVVIRMNDVDYAHLIMDNYTIDEGSVPPKVRIGLIDKLIETGFEYNHLHLENPTCSNIVKDICKNLGITFENPTSLINDVVIPKEEYNLVAREYLQYIGELNGGFFRIGNNGRLYFKNFSNQDSKIINPDLCEHIVVGKKQTIERVVFENGIEHFETSPDASLQTLSLNSDNPFITSVDLFNTIANTVLGFMFSDVSTGNCEIDTSYELGDVFSIEFNDETYYSIVQYQSLDYFGKWNGGYDLSFETFDQNKDRLPTIADKIRQDKKKWLEQFTEYEKASSKLSETLSKLVGVYPSKDVLEDGSEILYWHNKPTREESNIQWKFNGVALAYSNDFGVTWKGHDVENDSFVASIIYASIINADQIRVSSTKTLVDNLNELENVDSDTNTRIDDLGLTIEQNTTIDGEPVSEKVAKLTADYLSLSSEVGNFKSGGTNIILNSNYGNVQEPSDIWWGTTKGISWSHMSKRYNTWGNVKVNAKTWNNMKSYKDK